MIVLKSRNLLMVLILFTALMSCNRRGPVWEQMDMAENMMNSQPDSALIILNNIPASNIKGKETSARYALLKSIALDKNYIDTTNFDVLQPAIDYYLRKGNADEKLRTYYYQGRIYQNGEKNDSALQCFMRGQEYFGQATDTLTMGNLLVAKGTIYFLTYRYKDFTKVNLAASKLYKALGNTDYEMSCLANVWDGSLSTHDQHLADSVKRVAEEHIKDEEKWGAFFSPYFVSHAIVFGDKEDIIAVIHHYDTVQNLDDVTKMDLAEAYRKIGDSSNALRAINSISKTSQVTNALKYLAIKPDILELNGDYKGALEAYREYSATSSCIDDSIFSQDLLFAKRRHEMEKSNLLSLQKRDRIIGYCLFVALVLLIVAVFIYYRYRLSRAKSIMEQQENKRLQLEQETLQQANEKLELERHYAILEKQTAELETERQALIADDLRNKIRELENESASLKEILEKPGELDKPIKDAIKFRLELLNGLLASEISDNQIYAAPYNKWKSKLLEDKNEFLNSTRVAIQATHPEFIRYLENKGFTVEEINYVCLYAIGLKGKEVGEYMQIKRPYHFSSEIRKKFGIDKHDTNLNLYIRKLMNEL